MIELGRRDILVGAGALLAGGFERTGAMSTPIARFSLPYDAAAAADLKARLAATRWNDAVTADWSYGMARAPLQRFVRYWGQDYDAAAAVRRLNRLPHHRAEVDGFGVHFLHFRSSAPGAIPLLLMNGWPSTFVEYGRLTPLLVEPDEAGVAFDVVIPTLPGFGYSDHPTRPWQVDTVELFHRLMTETLGYRRFLASGTDIGAGVATRLGLAHPGSMLGVHVSAIPDPVLAKDAPPLNAEELAYRAEMARWDDEEGAYQHLQSTRPQTAAFGLNDSPAGLASWIVEKFHFWSDHAGDLTEVFPLEMLADTLSIYWATGAIGSSMRYYYDSRHFRPPLKVGDRVGVPTAISVWPKDLVRPPRAWCERLYDVVQYTAQPRGGHFPAWETPELYATDLRRFARTASQA
jgi:pimeloyl-ACP methyl ester carboxylesterase